MPWRTRLKRMVSRERNENTTATRRELSRRKAENARTQHACPYKLLRQHDITGSVSDTLAPIAFVVLWRDRRARDIRTSRCLRYQPRDIDPFRTHPSHEDIEVSTVTTRQETKPTSGHWMLSLRLTAQFRAELTHTTAPSLEHTYTNSCTGHTYTEGRHLSRNSLQVPSITCAYIYADMRKYGCTCALISAFRQLIVLPSATHHMAAEQALGASTGQQYRPCIVFIVV